MGYILDPSLWENPLLMKGDVFIMFLSLINLVTRRSLNPVQYHHANPFTLIRLHS